LISNAAVNPGSGCLMKVSPLHWVVLYIFLIFFFLSISALRKFGIRYSTSTSSLRSSRLKKLFRPWKREAKPPLCLFRLLLDIFKIPR
jgi:hypothetical protein